MRGKHRRERPSTGRGPAMTLGLMLGLLLAMAMPVAAGGPAPKVDVCHADGEGGFHLINISENAFQAHLDHGDVSPGDPVPGHGGMVFGPDCAVEAAPVTPIADGSFSNPYNGTLLTIGFSLDQEWDGDYTGTGSYAYGANSFTLTITDACVDEAGKRITVRGTATGNLATYQFGFLSIRDNGNGTFSARVAALATAAEIDGFYATQCGGAPLYPANGSTGSLIFH